MYSKCKVNRKFFDKRKNHYIKEMVDKFVPTCLCVSIFMVMFALSEHHFQAL